MPFTIGAIGHRVLPAEEEAIVLQIASVLDHFNSRHSDRKVAVVSSVAEGSDRHFLAKAAELGLEYDCVLPCSPECFREDFESAESRDQFDRLLAGARSIIQPDSQIDKETGYIWASDAVLDRSDELVAVWDGGEGLGEAGTAATIVRALARGIPVTWISAHPPHVSQVLGPDAKLLA